MNSSSISALRRQLQHKIRAHVRLLVLRPPARPGEWDEVVHEIDLLRRIEDTPTATEVAHDPAVPPAGFPGHDSGSATPGSQASAPESR